MDWKLELVVVPVADVDRAKDFYVDRLGWTMTADHRAGDDFRVVQAVPPGSACAVALMRNPGAAGSLQGLHLVVSDIEAALGQLHDRQVEASDLFHFVDGVQTAGPDEERRDYNTFFSLADPDGNQWLVQEVGRRP